MNIRQIWANWGLATRFLVVYLILSTLTVVALTWRYASQIAYALEQEVEHELELEAFIVASVLRTDVEGMVEGRRDAEQVVASLYQFARDIDARITLLDRNLNVIFSTDARIPLHREEMHPEFVAALAGTEEHDVRVDEWTGEQRLFVAAPIRDGDHIFGLVQISIPWERVQVLIYQQWSSLVLAGALAILANIAVSLWLARSIIAHLRRLTEGARRLASGHLDERIVVNSKDEVGQLAIAFNEMAAWLQRTIENQRLFIASASHELRSPLTSLKLRTEALLENEDMPPEQQRRFLQEIDKEVQRLQRLADNLLDLTRLQMRSKARSAQPVHLADILKETIHVFTLRAARSRIHLVSEIPTDLPPVYASPEDLEEIFFNLLDNALKYTPPGGRVELSAKAEGDYVVVTVTDTGRGIPPEDLPYIFEPFYRVDKARSSRSGGSGLGLSIVKEIVETLGGRIKVTSEVHKGTTFSVFLPVHVEDAHPGAQEPRAKR